MVADFMETFSAKKLLISLEKPLKEVVRPDWDTYFLGIARAVSARGDCSRRQIGAVVVNSEHRIVATGYNGVAPGVRGCLSQPCPRVSSEIPCEGYSDCRSVHAEANALLYAGQQGCVGAALYITDEPCKGCMKLIQAMQIEEVVWPEGRLGPDEWALPGSESPEHWIYDN